MSLDQWEAVIGLEVHCQLATGSKIFSNARARLGAGHSVSDEVVNANTNPICAGHPGTLPVLNKRAVEYAARAGFALDCAVHEKSIFSRKHYFYPDLPKGYQISQFDKPICTEGKLKIELKNGIKKEIRIERIHMEEDAGKNVHLSGFSLVNLNRAGVPLIEIVSGPDMRSSEEAGAYLRALYAIVTTIGICDGNLQEGNFRCDANVSVRPRGQKELGTRAEIKNVNSFRFVEKAIDFEIARQIQVIMSGGRVVMETRLYDSAKNQTISMRSKENAEDYRFFPEPDLPPLIIAKEELERIRKSLPELPEQKRNRFVEEYALSSYDAGVLTSSKAMAEFFDTAVKRLNGDKPKAKTVANLLTGELARMLNEAGLEISESKFTPVQIADLADALSGQLISSTGGKVVLAKLWEDGGNVADVIEKEGLKQVSDTSALEKIIEEVISANPGQTADYKAGKTKLLGFFVGQAMKASQGKANPALLQELVLKKLG